MGFSLTDFLTSLGGEGGDAVNTAAALGLAGGGLALAKQGYDDLGQVGDDAFDYFSEEGGLADKLSGMLEFQPYTVTSATGGSFGMTEDPNTGQMSYNLQ